MRASEIRQDLLSCLRCNKAKWAEDVEAIWSDKSPYCPCCGNRDEALIVLEQYAPENVLMIWEVEQFDGD